MPHGKWKPPNAGRSAPAALKHHLKVVYSGFRDKHPSENPAVKRRGAQIAWASAKKAGWKKGPDGRWHKYR
jgi:hypothetical protein